MFIICSEVKHGRWKTLLSDLIKGSEAEVKVLTIFGQETEELLTLVTIQTLKLIFN